MVEPRSWGPWSAAHQHCCSNLETHGSLSAAIALPLMMSAAAVRKQGACCRALTTGGAGLFDTRLTVGILHRFADSVGVEKSWRVSGKTVN